MDETEVPVTVTDNSSSLENTTIDRKRLISTNDEDLPEKKAKRPRNNSFRYWQVEVEDAGDSPSILEAVNTIDTISRALPVSSTSIGLKFVKSVTCQQVRATVKDYQCGEITRMDCSAFRKLDNLRNDKKKTDNDKPSRPRIYLTNSCYTFTTVGETFAERVANVKKILSMSPVKKPQQQHVYYPKGIREIHFFTTDLAEGCFAVRNKVKAEEGEQHSLVKYYKGLITDIENVDHNKYKSLIRQRNMRRHIKSWICICPYYATDGVPPTNDVVAKKGISAYRLFNNDLSIFQFESQRSVITPVEAAEAMGAMHKSLCFQSSGNIVRKLLADNDSSNMVASMGDLTYRSKWRNNDKRATKWVKFYSVADDKKITDQDILDIVNTEKIFHSIHFREDDRAYGVAKKSGNEKIVPSTIKLSDDSKIRFTAITLNEFNATKTGMNCFNTWRKGPKANTFENIASTAFSEESKVTQGCEERGSGRQLLRCGQDGHQCQGMQPGASKWR